MPRPAVENAPTRATDPPTLLAILIGARRTGDHVLERVVRRALETDHRIKVIFLGASERREAAPCHA
jgi:hypothetical protein